MCSPQVTGIRTASKPRFFTSAIISFEVFGCPQPVSQVIMPSFFNNYSEKLIFEGFNEYLGGKQFDKSGFLRELRRDQGYNLTNAMNKAFVNAVRSTGKIMHALNTALFRLSGTPTMTTAFTTENPVLSVMKMTGLL